MSPDDPTVERSAPARPMSEERLSLVIGAGAGVLVLFAGSVVVVVRRRRRGTSHVTRG